MAPEEIYENSSVAWMQRSKIQESALWLSVPPYFAALHTGYA
jgi:hypothetical protein